MVGQRNKFNRVKSVPIAGIAYHAVAARAEVPEGYEPVFDLIRNHRLDVKSLITHRVSLEEIETGLELMNRKQDGVLKVVICP